MTFAYFLHVDGAADAQQDLQSWADQRMGPALRRASPASRIEAYAPEGVADPYLGNETGKLLILRANFQSPAALETAMQDNEVRAALAAMPRSGEVRATAEFFSIQPCPLLDGSTPPRRAPVSFVVRYYRPIEREREFTDYYIGHHPPIMARFPRIRNIYCYLPVDWEGATSVASADSFLGNEIVFDSVADLDAALSSAARHELREDFKNFLPHEGEVTHFAMRRRLLFSGADD